MKKPVLLGALALVATTFAAGAQTSEFYVVRDTAAKKCMVVDKKPAASTTVTVAGDGTVYKTRTEAESAIKTTKACTEM